MWQHHNPIDGSLLFDGMETHQAFNVPYLDGVVSRPTDEGLSIDSRNTIDTSSVTPQSVLTEALVEVPELHETIPRSTGDETAVISEFTEARHSSAVVLVAPHNVPTHYAQLNDASILQSS